MQQWTYEVFEVEQKNGPERLKETLNRLGSDGWEVVAATALANGRLQLLLKQPKP
jgi:hypothetical protein